MTVIRKELLIKAPREKVWRHLEDPDLLAAWLMRNTFTGKVGEDFQFLYGPSGEWDGVLRCRLLELIPPRKMAFTWDASDIRAETLVTIELEETADGTCLRLTHANFEASKLDVVAIVRNHDEGWTDHLAVLSRQVLEESAGSREPPFPTDWTRFDLHMAIRAEPERVLRAWSTIDGMERFFVELMRITAPDGHERGVHEPAHPGDRYVWRWHDGRALRGEYLECPGPHEVAFSFGQCRVRVSVRRYEDGSLLRLRQSDMADDEATRMHVHSNCRAAWGYFLTILKTWLEHGVDARDTTRGTGASLSTYFDPASVGVAF